MKCISASLRYTVLLFCAGSAAQYLNTTTTPSSEEPLPAPVSSENTAITSTQVSEASADYAPSSSPAQSSPLEPSTIGLDADEPQTTLAPTSFLPEFEPKVPVTAITESSFDVPNPPAAVAPATTAADSDESTGENATLPATGINSSVPLTTPTDVADASATSDIPGLPGDVITSSDEGYRPIIQPTASAWDTPGTVPPVAANGTSVESSIESPSSTISLPAFSYAPETTAETTSETGLGTGAPSTTTTPIATAGHTTSTTNVSSSSPSSKLFSYAPESPSSFGTASGSGYSSHATVSGSTTAKFSYAPLTSEPSSPAFTYVPLSTESSETVTSGGIATHYAHQSSDSAASPTSYGSTTTAEHGAASSSSQSSLTTANIGILTVSVGSEGDYMLGSLTLHPSTTITQGHGATAKTIELKETGGSTALIVKAPGTTASAFLPKFGEATSTAAATQTTSKGRKPLVYDTSSPPAPSGERGLGQADGKTMETVALTATSTMPEVVTVSGARATITYPAGTYSNNGPVLTDRAGGWVWAFTGILLGVSVLS